MSLFTGATLLGVALAGGASSVAAAKINSSGQKSAADAALQGTQAGLDFLKGQKAKQEQAAAPYLALGQQATSALPGAVRPSPLGGPPAPFSTQSAATRPSMPLGQFGAPQGSPMPSPAAPMPVSGGGQMLVTLQAPDGSTRQVPQAQVQFYVSRGAQVVQQPGM